MPLIYSFCLPLLGCWWFARAMPPPPSSGTTSLPPAPPTSFAQSWVLACGASMVSESVTYPLDHLKTRLQLQNELGRTLTGAAATAPPSTMTSILKGILKKEGVGALFSGLSIAVTRQFFNAGISVGLYPVLRARILGEGETKETMSLYKRAACGAITGCIGQSVAQPLDVIKTRVQADGRLRAAGLKPRYNGVGDCFSRILAEEGVRGFYTALSSSVWRAGIINAAGIASYDGTKQWTVVALRERGGAGYFSPLVMEHAPSIYAAFVCGLVSTVVSCPLDVVKTRIINASPGTYKNPGDCFMQLVRKEGVASMWKGVVPTYQRQALWNGIFWVMLENIQRVAGLERL